ncbi:MAG: S-layer homology domain-containing protein [Peptococcaceae bacterium]|nr:S-layer homology domain-containing protein [Peptococcaceae bacterium]
MKRSMTQRSMAVVLTAALLAPTSAFGASASDFSDFPSDWSTQALTNAVDNGLLGGYGGKIDAKGTLTRAQMAAIINRAFGSTAEASLDDVNDVSAGSWYRDDMAKALQMGTFVGVGDGKLNPDANITRQEVLAVLARAFAIEDADTDALDKFSDADDVSAWAQKTVAAMVKAGYINGYEDGTLNPKGTITRAEFAAIMDNIAKDYITASGSYDKVADGNVIVRAGGVDLSGMTIRGDLILADGVGTDDVNLDGVTVQGRIVVRGGDSDSVKLKNVTARGGIVVTNPNRATGLVIEDGSIASVTAKTDLVIDGNVGAVNVRDGASVSVKDGSVGSVTVDKDSTGSAITVDKGATVTTVEANGKNAKVSGEGTVTTVRANADGAAITVPSAKVEVADGASNVTAGGVAVAPGKDVTVNSKGDGITSGSTGGGGSIGGGGGGSVTPDPEPEKNPMTDAQKQSLTELIAKAQTLVDADASLTDLAAVVKDAQALVDNKDATADAATAMITRLEKAIDAVPEKDPMTDAQKQSLTELIAKAQTLVDADASLTDLAAAIKDAQALVDDKDATSDAATAMITRLEKAIDAVPEKPSQDVVTATSKAVPVTPPGSSYTVQATVTVDRSKNDEITDVKYITSDTGANSTWISMFESGKDARFYGKLVGLNKDTFASTVDGFNMDGNHDAVSGATLTSKGVLAAVEDAYDKATSDVAAPEAPAVSTPDRTEPLFAATGNASLSVSAPEGATVLYTTDGSNPATEAGGATKALAGTTLTVEPGENTTHETTVKLIAVVDGQESAVTTETVQFIRIPQSSSGTKVYEGSVNRAGMSGGPYDIKVRVTTTDGKITAVEDNGTRDGVNNATDAGYWDDNKVMDAATGMPSKLIGKTLEQVINMKTVPSAEGYNTDAVSGATVWSDSIRYAVIAALQTSPVSGSTVAAPTLSADANCTVNEEYFDIEVEMAAAKDTTIHYTLDGSEPTIDSPVAQKLGYYGDTVGVKLTADPEKYPDGQVIQVRAAAFAEDNSRSPIVSDYYVFANAPKDFAYEDTVYNSADFTATVDGVTAKATISTPQFNDVYYVTKIAISGISGTDDYLPELLSRVYLAQTTKGVAPVAGHEADSQRILAAVQAALDQSATAATPTISLSPEGGEYSNDTTVTVKITTPTPNAHVYYTVNYESEDGSYSHDDPEKVGEQILYTGPFELKAKSTDADTVYIQATATTDPEPVEGAEDTRKWPKTASTEIDFLKGVAQDAIVVNGTPVSSWDAAVEAINASDNGGTITIGEDFELPDEAQMPTKPCTITSKDGKQYTLDGYRVYANADLTLENVTFDASYLYAQGHNVTIGDNVKTTGWLPLDFYAGSKDKDMTLAEKQTITVNSGRFTVYTCGDSGTSFTGDVDVQIGGTAKASLMGAAYRTTVNGNMTFTVDGNGGQATLEKFDAADSSGTFDGTIKLSIIGAPVIYTINGLEGTGDAKSTLDLSRADASVDASKFTDFGTVIPQS